MSKPWCGILPQGVRITVQVAPNARRSEVMGVMEDAVKIRLQAQPIEGQANEALVRFLADKLKVPRTAVKITHGQTSKRKIVEIRAVGLDEAKVMQLLDIERDQ
jgi:uncharacterized protein